MPVDVSLYRTDIEFVLGPAVVAMLHSFARARGLSASEWATQPDLAQVATSQAALAIIAEARAAGSSMEAAINEAAVRTGIEPEALVKRRAAWLRHARKKGRKFRGHEPAPVVSSSEPLPGTPT